MSNFTRHSPYWISSNLPFIRHTCSEDTHFLHSFQLRFSSLQLFFFFSFSRGLLGRNSGFLPSLSFLRYALLLSACFLLLEACYVVKTSSFVELSDRLSTPTFTLALFFLLFIPFSLPLSFYRLVRWLFMFFPTCQVRVVRFFHSCSSSFLPSLPFPSLPFPSLPFPSLPFPSLPFPSLPSFLPSSLLPSVNGGVNGR